MDFLQNLDLLSVGIAAASTVILGFTVFFSNPSSITNKTFLGLSLVTFLWGIVNYSFYQISNVDFAFSTLRIVLFLALWQAFLLFQFFYVIPLEKAKFPKWHTYIIFPLTALTSILVLTPFVLSEVTEVINGRITRVENGPAMALFGALASGLVFTGFYFLLRKIRRAKEKWPLRIILLGTLITFTLIIVFNLIFPTLYGNSSFIPLGSLFVLPLILFTSYATLRHRLFNIKVAGVSLLIFALAVVTFGEIILADNFFLIIYRSAILLLVLAFGVLLIKGVTKEVEQREHIEVQRKELEIANREQESLLHFVSHEVKGYLTKSEAGFSAINDGTYGEISSDLKKMSTLALSEMRKGVATVMDILSASDLKKGTVNYAKNTFNFKEAVLTAVKDLKPSAEEKGLKIDLSIEEGRYIVVGDEEKLRENAIRNLIDNAVKYTPEGTIRIKLSDGDIVHFSVEDSGIGITPEDMKKLFTEGGHGKDSLKINVHSTGYGLFIAKKVVEAHGGKIWAESKGQGRGARFIVELPVA